MELFTTGPGPYDERDVKEAARAFTGHHLRNGRFVFSEPAHDPGPKTVLGVAGHLDGDDVVDILAGHPATARFLAREARAALPHATIRPQEDVAGIERPGAQNGGDVREVLATLFRSERVLRGLRALRGHPLARRADRRGGEAARLGAAAPVKAAQHAFAMGQALLDPPTVKGYPGGRKWLNPATLLARRTFLLESVAAARLARRASARARARGRRTSRTACEALLGARPTTPRSMRIRQATLAAERTGRGRPRRRDLPSAVPEVLT